MDEGERTRREVLGDEHVDRTLGERVGVRATVPGLPDRRRVGRGVGAARARPPHALVPDDRAAHRRCGAENELPMHVRAAIKQRRHAGGDPRGDHPRRPLRGDPEGERRDEARRASRGRTALQRPAGPALDRVAQDRAGHAARAAAAAAELGARDRDDLDARLVEPGVGLRVALVGARPARARSRACCCRRPTARARR